MTVSINFVDLFCGIWKISFARYVGLVYKAKENYLHMVVQDKLPPLGGQLSTFVHTESSDVDSNTCQFSNFCFTFLQILVHKKQRILHSQ